MGLWKSDNNKRLIILVSDFTVQIICLNDLFWHFLAPLQAPQPSSHGQVQFGQGLYGQG